MKIISKDFNFARLTILLHSGFNEENTPARKHRHDKKIHTARRAEIAQLRNHLMLTMLREEQHLLWLDGDIFKLDEGIIQRMFA